MRKNYVVFGPTSGRGISKTKALFDCLSLHYYYLLRLPLPPGSISVYSIMLTRPSWLFHCTMMESL